MSLKVLARGKSKITGIDTETWMMILKARAKGPFKTESDFERGKKYLGGNGNENYRAKSIQH